MGLPLTPLVPANPARSKIVWPSQPPEVPPPSLSSSSGGSLTAQSLYVQLTWVIVTQDGAQHESLPSEEVETQVAANNLLNVASPQPLNMPYALIGYNVYVGNASGKEQLQNSTPINIGTAWVEPTSGLVAGPPPPSTWGNTLVFIYPGREFPFFNMDWKGHDELSTAGWQQSITWYVDNIVDFRMPMVQAGNDAAQWKQFMQSAILRVPFDLYQDSTLPTYVTLILMDTSPKLAWRNPGLYSTDLKCRQAILSQ